MEKNLKKNQVKATESLRFKREEVVSEIKCEQKIKKDMESKLSPGFNKEIVTLEKVGIKIRLSCVEEYEVRK